MTRGMWERKGRGSEGNEEEEGWRERARGEGEIRE